MGWAQSSGQSRGPLQSPRSLRQTVVLTGGSWPVVRGYPLPPQASWTRSPLPWAWALLLRADWAPSSPSKAQDLRVWGMRQHRRQEAQAQVATLTDDSLTRPEAHLRASSPGPLKQAFCLVLYVFSYCTSQSYSRRQIIHSR